MSNVSRGTCLVASLVAGLSLFLGLPACAGAKDVVDFFGTPPGESGTHGGEMRNPHGIAVNNTGAGPASKGDIYVTDSGNNRIERFGRDDHGTPADTTDDSYFFISAWGADVDADPSGGSDYEICTVALQCKEGIASGGNGTTAGDGGLDSPLGLAVDQDSGEVYVADSFNRRVAVYDGAGVFLRSFGVDVVESGPDNNGAGYEVCGSASGDVCKKGLNGSAVGQIATPESDNAGIALSPPDGNASSGTVFVADGSNHRIDTFELDGSSPSSLGSEKFYGGVNGWGQPTQVAVDSRGILYAPNITAMRPGSILSSRIERYDSENANGSGVGFLPPITGQEDEGQELVVTANGGQYKLTFEGEATADIAYDATAAQLQGALQALNAIKAGTIRVAGGPGNGFGAPSGTYYIAFSDGLGSKDLPQLIPSNGSTPLSGGSATVSTVNDGGPTGPLPRTGSGTATRALAVDPSQDALYVIREGRQILQFGPLNDPGLIAAPTVADTEHGTNSNLDANGLTLDQGSGDLYVTSFQGGDQKSEGVYVLGAAGPPPSASLDSIDGITSTSSVAHVTINPNGPPALSYWLEYSDDGAEWSRTATTALGTQTTPQALAVPLAPPGGLSPSTLYHVRLVTKRTLNAAAVTAELTFTTLGERPEVETVGAPLRSAATADLSGRVNPRNSAATYYFEYGAAGSCDSNPCESTPVRTAGSGDEVELVSERIEGLQPGTTYHYRLVADNGEVGSPSAGEDEAVATRPSDLPLSHGHFTGPPGSDRAYEQVSLSDASGNPVNSSRTALVSTNGERVIYEISGGADLTESGNGFGNVILAERPPGAHPEEGWHSRTFTPARSSLPESPRWALSVTPELSSAFGVVESNGDSSSAGWALPLQGQPTELFAGGEDQETGPLLQGISEDGSRKLLILHGGVPDPAYPGAGAAGNIYDVSSGAAELVSVLPNDVPACVGIAYTEPAEMPESAADWISPDGSLAYFTSKGNAANCDGPRRVYARELAADQTTLVSGAPVSGLTCDSYLLRATGSVAYFFTTSRMAPDDIAPPSCDSESVHSNGDIYRYDLGSGSRECLTCTAPGGTADIVLQPSGRAANAGLGIGVDGSRIYFFSKAHLLPGSPPEGQQAIYRFDAVTDSLALVAAVEGRVGISLTSDGSVLTFRSNGASLNPLTGPTNAGTLQDYRYDDRDRSLVCLSCPEDGSDPVGVVGTTFIPPVSADGEVVAFQTLTPLLAADQNTPRAGLDPRIGADVYEWRDGRLILVTDGLHNWPSQGPERPAESPSVAGISASGRDVFFAAPIPYTPDALDGYRRLYDARIGGGIDFPEPPRPCPLEVCQGTPKGAPEEPPAGTSKFDGSSEPPSQSTRCPKDRVRRGGHCLKKRRDKRQRKPKHGKKAGARQSRRANR